MKPILAFLLSLTLLGCSPTRPAPSPAEPATIPAPSAKSIFWETPQRGANSFNVTPPDQAYFEALSETGASWVRLTFSKWDGEGRDFLIGTADQYTTIPATDLATLKRVLDHAQTANIKVVIAPLSLPGARWSQHNDGKFDDRLWSDKIYWEQSAQFWADLAKDLKDHPAVVAYNIVNEPAPEKTQAVLENGQLKDTAAFLKQQEGRPRDLLGFYDYIIAAIREQDDKTPIMVDAGYYANPSNLAAWPRPLADQNILYAIHVYEPYEATSAPNIKRKVKLRYPGTKARFLGEETAWDKNILSQHIGVAYAWADRNNIPSNRLLISEFGCVRHWADCGTYLTDILDIFETHNAHWAYYTFRPDEWDAMDYELPLGFKSGQYYWYLEEGRKADLPRDGELMQIIKRHIDE